MPGQGVDLRYRSAEQRYCGVRQSPNRYTSDQNLCLAAVDADLYLERVARSGRVLYFPLITARQATPPLPCGLLSGVLRGRLLASGDWIVQVLIPVDLNNAEVVWVGNALLGLMRGRFQGGKGANSA